MQALIKAVGVAEVVVIKDDQNARTIVKISDNAKLLIAGIALALVIIAPWIWPEHHITVIYDCNISEISPDIPVAVKEQCRKLMEKK